MKRRIRLLMIVLAATLALGACEKKEEPSAETPTEEATESATPAQDSPDEGATQDTGSADEQGAVAAGEKTTVATLGKPAPDFELTDDAGKTHRLADYRGKIVVLEWTNPECPYVQRHVEEKTMIETRAALEKKDVVWLAIDSSHFVKPEDSKKWRAEKSIPYPTLQDPAGEVGRLYAAKTTPHMYVVDAQGTLRYEGAIDDDPHGKKAKGERTNHVLEAVTALTEGKDVPQPTTKAYGCSVKYSS